MRIKVIDEKEGSRLGVKRYPIVPDKDKARIKQTRYLVKCGDKIYNLGGLKDDFGSVMSDGVKIYYFHSK